MRIEQITKNEITNGGEREKDNYIRIVNLMVMIIILITEMISVTIVLQ